MSDIKINLLYRVGLMTAEENVILEKLSKKNQQYFIPLAWATNLVSMARSENRIKDDYAQKTLIDVSNLPN